MSKMEQAMFMLVALCGLVLSHSVRYGRARQIPAGSPLNSFV